MSGHLSTERALALLEEGAIETIGQLPWSTNYTFLARVADTESDALAVYKPQRGERPLWDFASGTLCERETAAFVVSEALGWGLVPPTILRDGPLGLGAVQLFVHHDPEVHYLTLDSPDPTAVSRLAAFDVIINNADRKSGHVLCDETGRLWAIDHGISFHVEPKLRTVIWELAGSPLPTAIAGDATRLTDALKDPRSATRVALERLLRADEIDAAVSRARELVESGRFPDADDTRPAVPWPPV